VSPSTARCQPPPGTATEADVLRSPDGVKRLCELVDGVLVEKAMGFYESILAMVLGQLLLNFIDEHDLGVVTGPDGTIRLVPGLVRIPDVAFFSWSQFPNRQRPACPGTKAKHRVDEQSLDEDEDADGDPEDRPE